MAGSPPFRGVGSGGAAKPDPQRGVSWEAALGPAKLPGGRSQDLEADSAVGPQRIWQGAQEEQPMGGHSTSPTHGPPAALTFTPGSLLVPKCATIRSTAMLMVLTRPGGQQQTAVRSWEAPPSTLRSPANRQEHRRGLEGGLRPDLPHTPGLGPTLPRAPEALRNSAFLSPGTGLAGGPACLQALGAGRRTYPSSAAGRWRWTRRCRLARGRIRPGASPPRRSSPGRTRSR